MRHIMCGCVAILILVISAFGQTQPPAPVDTNTEVQKVKDIRELFTQREQVLSQRNELNQKVWDLYWKLQRLPRLDDLERDVGLAKTALERAEKNSRPKEELESLQRNVDTIAANLDVVRRSAPEYENTVKQFEDKNRQLFAIEQRIASLYDNTQAVNSFRLAVAITFATLVFFVITGFFVIAWAKDVAKTIFSGEMGMQFVTLFLIVIAIILFGIMGTLEGKELAALLGGLSGYILGRAATHKPARNKDTAEIEQPAKAHRATKNVAVQATHPAH